MTNIIERNKSKPCNGVKEFTTVEDNQENVNV